MAFEYVVLIILNTFLNKRAYVVFNFEHVDVLSILSSVLRSLDFFNDTDDHQVSMTAALGYEYLQNSIFLAGLLERRLNSYHQPCPILLQCSWLHC